MATLTFDVLYRGAAAERGMKNLGDTTERTGKRFSGLKVAGAAALAAVGVAAVKFGGQSVRAYVEAEASQLRLQDAFRKFPKLADTNIGALNKLNTELAKKTRFDDDATASGQAVLAQFKLTGQQITQLTPLLQDYAAKTGKDLPTAARDLGKAMLGQGRSLKSVGIDFKDTGTQSGNLDQIMRGLRTQVGGFAEKEGKSAAGRAAILKNQFGELQEAAGKQLLPALMKAGDGLLRFFGFIEDNAPLFKSFKTIATAAFDALTVSVGKGKLSFKTFGDYVSTHQADIIGVFVKAGKFAIEFGKGLTWMAIGGLRAIGTLDAGVGRFISGFITHTGKIVGAAARAFGWIPGIGPKLKAADIHFQMWASGAKKGFENQGKGAKAAADKLENQLIPALDKSGRKFDEIAKKEIWKAKQRDAANAARIAIRDIGTAADGSQIKIKKWSDISKLGADKQAALRDRIREARTRMLEQRDAGIKAGASQAQLTKRWEQGERALYKEFRQMGLSKEEAKRLAAQYTKIPGKKETKVSAPGAVKTRNEIRDVDKAIENTRGKNVSVDISVNSQLNKLNRAIVKEYGKGGIKIAVAGGGVLPGFTPGRDVHDFYSPTGGRLALSGGEAVMRPEWTRAVGGRAAVARMNASARGGRGPGFADGGVVANTRARGETYNYSKLRDYASDFSRDAARAMTRNLGLQATREAFAAATAAAKKARDAAAAAADTSAPGGRPGKVNVGRGWGPIQAAMRRRGARSFTTYPGHHPSMARARDVTPHNWSMANAARALSSVWYVIYRMKIASKNHGNGWRTYHPTNRRGDWRHVRHIHVARYGNGTNSARAGGAIVGEYGPEYLQMRGGERVTPMPSYTRVGAGGGRTVIININPSFPNFVGDRSDLKRHLVNMGRSGDLKAALQAAGVR